MEIRSPRPTTGPASVAQGVYGAAGNLELIAADAVDGLWVHWFNADPPGTEPVSGVAPGEWSGGMLFAEGTAYSSAVIHQSRRGPDYLEVIAVRADGGAESWYWSPGPGFQRRGGLLPGGGDAVLTEHDGGFILQLGERVFAASAAAYPALPWRDVTPTGADPGTLRIAVSTRDGGMLELAYRRDGALHHDAVPLAR
ncbi:hypothetical protein [Schumannella luteola]